MSSLTEFLLERVAEDEAVARAAVDPRRPGTHWQWVNNENDEILDGGRDNEFRISLRTVEEFPTQSVGPLPAFPLGYVEADETYALPHIARHDPARVLAECEAKRRIVETVSAYCWDQTGVPKPCGECDRIGCRTLRLLALPYAGHEGFKEEWRP